MGKLALLGGKKLREKPFGPHPVLGEEESRIVAEVLVSGQMSGFIAKAGDSFLGGPKVKKLEEEFCRYFGVKYAIAVNSATSGLHAAVAALNLGPGDEVIVPPYTMTASATSILMNNSIPVFVDITDDIFCLDPQKLEKAITPRTKAILVVHLFGQSAPMDEIMRIAKKHKLYVIEDVAQAPAATFKGKYCGTFGDLAVFSLNQHKTITTGEGGVIVTNNERLAQKARLVRNHGEAVVADLGLKDIINALGWNYRMTETEAAIGIAQFGKLDFLTDYRIDLAEYLTEKLSAYQEYFTLPVISKGNRHVYFSYAMKYQAAKAGISRDVFVKAVVAEGFPLGAGYVKPIYLEPLFQRRICYGEGGCPFTCKYYKGKVNYKKGLCPITERMYYRELIATGICRYPLTKEDIDGFVAALDKVLQNKHELKALSK